MKKVRNHTVAQALTARLAVMLLILVTLGTVLAGCAGQTATSSLTLNEEALVITEDNALNKEQLTLLAKEIQESDNALTVRAQLVAALNGYDMTTEGFDDEHLPEAHPENAPAYALNVLKKYEITTYESTDAMTVFDVQVLVGCFKTVVATDATIGFIDRILGWIALGLEWLINVPGFGNFILGTFYFAILVEILMLPLAIHQQKNARKQARLRPKEMAIRKKYAGRNDQKTMQDMQTEIQTMYQNEGYSPMTSGCLPLLVSLPVIWALYYIVIDPLKYMMACPSDLANALSSFAQAPRAAGGLGMTLQSTRGTIEILSRIREMGVDSLASFGNFQYFTNSGDCLETLQTILANHTIPNFSLGSVNFGLTPSITSLNWLLLIPLLTFGVYFGSMKLNRRMTYQPASSNDPGMGCSNTIMDVSMPIVSAVFTFMVPGAVGIYWIFKSMITTLKQFIMSQVMPLPQFTDADYKAAEKELAAKEKGRPVKKSGGAKNPNVRSLHHIDDEDYETAAPQPEQKGKKAVPAPAEPASGDASGDAPADTETDAAKPDQPAASAALVNSAPLKEDKPLREKKKKSWFAKKDNAADRADTQTGESANQDSRQKKD